MGTWDVGKLIYRSPPDNQVQENSRISDEREMLTGCSPLVNPRKLRWTEKPESA